MKKMILYPVTLSCVLVSSIVMADEHANTALPQWLDKRPLPNTLMLKSFPLTFENSLGSPSSRPMVTPHTGESQAIQTTESPKAHTSESHKVKEKHFEPTGYIEAGVTASKVTNNFGNGFGQYIRGEVQTDPSNRWNAEIGHQDKFRSNGPYAALGNTHIWNKEWFTSVGVSGGANGDFLPQVRLDASINKIWEEYNLITTLGYMHFNAMDYHSSNSILLSGTYYFDSPWVLQGGIWFNWSDPGSVFSTTEFISIMHSKPKDYIASLRFDYGKEAYQVLGGTQTINNEFNSYSSTAGLRKWMGEDWGINTQINFYHNPFYNRTGGQLGVFYDF